MSKLEKSMERTAGLILKRHKITEQLIPCEYIAIGDNNTSVKEFTKEQPTRNPDDWEKIMYFTKLEDLNGIGNDVGNLKIEVKHNIGEVILPYGVDQQRTVAYIGGDSHESIIDSLPMLQALGFFKNMKFVKIDRRKDVLGTERISKVTIYPENIVVFNEFFVHENETDILDLRYKVLNHMRYISDSLSQIENGVSLSQVFSPELLKIFETMKVECEKEKIRKAKKSEYKVPEVCENTIMKIDGGTNIIAKNTTPEVFKLKINNGSDIILEPKMPKLDIDLPQVSTTEYGVFKVPKTDVVMHLEDGVKILCKDKIISDGKKVTNYGLLIPVNALETDGTNIVYTSESGTPVVLGEGKLTTVSVPSSNTSKFIKGAQAEMICGLEAKSNVSRFSNFDKAENRKFKLAPRAEMAGNGR